MQRDSQTLLRSSISLFFLLLSTCVPESYVSLQLERDLKKQTYYDDSCQAKAQTAHKQHIPPVTGPLIQSPIYGNLQV